jgi:hypothetical protein
MASKQRSNAVEVIVSKSNIVTRRSKQILTEQLSDTKKNVVRVIEKPKLNTDKKPQNNNHAITNSKQKKVHKCSICDKEFKGVYTCLCVCVFLLVKII